MALDFLFRYYASSDNKSYGKLPIRLDKLLRPMCVLLREYALPKVT